MSFSLLVSVRKLAHVISSKRCRLVYSVDKLSFLSSAVLVLMSINLFQLVENFTPDTFS